ncbi:MAG: hypothetical protein R3B13_32495 [Polyangiaceae bacterium]
MVRLLLHRSVVHASAVLSTLALFACSDSNDDGGGGGSAGAGNAAGNGASAGSGASAGVGASGGSAGSGGTAGSGASAGSGGTGASSSGGTGALPAADPIVLDDFSDLRTNSVLPNPESPPQPLWYPQHDSSNPSVSNSTLTLDVAGAPQIYFRSVDNLGWYFIRKLVESGTWSDSGFNRLRFRVKQAQGMSISTSGGHNIEWASFLHVGSKTDGPWSGSDDNNWHFYHFLDIPSDGLWYHVIIDTYPDHQRGEPGADEQGDQEFPSGGNQYNYFSMMTSFYYDLPYASASGQVQFREFSLFYEDNATVPLAQVRSLNGAYDPATHTVKLGWGRRKDQSGHGYSVAWSYSPITSFGSATLAGSLKSPNTDAYNGVHYTFSEADFANHPRVWVAIQPEGATTFRQIAIDLQ